MSSIAHHSVGLRCQLRKGGFGDHMRADHSICSAWPGRASQPPDSISHIPPDSSLSAFSNLISSLLISSLHPPTTLPQHITSYIFPSAYSLADLLLPCSYPHPLLFRLHLILNRNTKDRHVGIHHQPGVDLYPLQHVIHHNTPQDPPWKTPL